MVMATKQLYKLTAMYRREVIIRYGYAYSPVQARAIILRRMADEQGMEPCVVFGYFKDHPDSVSIQIETEFKEVDN
jgi:hypothetical protein